MILTETGINTGIFLGFINTRAMPPAAVAGDCILSVQRNDTLQVAINNTTTGFEIGNGAIDILVDPFGIVSTATMARPSMARPSH